MYKTRLERLLALMPWLVSSRGTSVEQIAQRFSISRNEVISDLTTLTMTGPGEYGGQLVDIQISDSGSVTVVDSQGLDHPLKIGDHEAKLLSMTIVDLLSRLPSELQVHASLLLDKLNNGNNYLQVAATSDETSSQILDPLVEAVETRSVIRFTYHSDGKNPQRERVLSPFRIDARPTGSLLSGYCHMSNAVRTFRIDQMADVQIDPKMKFISTDEIDTTTELIRIEALISRSIEDSLKQYPGYEVVKVKGNDLRVRFNVYTETHAIKLILQNRAFIHVVEPASINDKVDILISDFLSRV
ncbi:MAG: helix-turn-helix transcriptional regulator [Gammaproteobacteria bacterium]